MLENHIVGFQTAEWEGGWLITYSGTLPVSESELKRDDADDRFTFCPTCGARILPTGPSDPNG